MTKKKWLWSVLFLLIAGLSVWAVVSQNQSFSFDEFMTCLKGMSIPYLALAILCMLGFIVFEGLAVQNLAKAFGYRRGFVDGFIWSAADVYFSAITPSASGGQPVSAWFMIKDGIPGMTTTVILIINLVMYTVAVLAVGVLTAVCAPGVFLGFNWLGRILIILGFIVMVFLGLAFYMLLRKPQILKSLCDWVLDLGVRLHIVRGEKEQAFRDQLAAKMAEYATVAGMLKGRGKLLLQTFLFNFLQRVSRITVTLMVYLGMGCAVGNAGKIWFTQCLTEVGTYTIPIPGGMGISDYLMLQGYQALLDKTTAANLELISRSLSFYCCVLISLITVIYGYFRLRRKTA